MGNIRRSGTLIPGGNKFPIAFSKDIQGGLHTVATLEDLQTLIDTNRAEYGMLVKVLNVDTYYEYKLDGTWEEASFSGVGNAVLGTIYALQAEVAKLRNSFLYGIDSYNGEDTAASRVVLGYKEVDDKEPLWAINEGDLSYIPDLKVSLDKNTEIIPIEDTFINTSVEGELGLEHATWVDGDGILKDDDSAKLFIYLAATNLNIDIKLNSVQDTPLSIFLQNLLTNNTVDSYHIMIMVSRLYKDKGKLYIYISIDNNITGLNIAKGYYNGTSLQQDPYYLTNNYYFTQIIFKNLKLTKLNFYTKYQDFSSEVTEIQSIAPKELDYKYRAAHITVREVANDLLLEQIKNHLLKPELVWVADQNILKINTSSGIYTIGAANSENNMADLTTIKTALSDLGIVLNTEGNLELSPVSLINFKSSDLLTYSISVDSDGNLNTFKEPDLKLSEIIPKSSTFKMKTGTSNFSDMYNRGFAAKVLYKKNNSEVDVDKDWKLNSDRIKIGSFYAGLKAEDKHCSHAFIELENTSNDDFPLDGCVIAFTYPESVSGQIQLKIISTELQGVIPKGGTYLIRGKRYTNNTVINVDTFDIEWLDLDTDVDFTLNGDIGFLLCYKDSTVNLNNPVFTTLNNNAGTSNNATNLYGADTGTNPYLYLWYYIDSVGIKLNTDDSKKLNWFPKVVFSIKLGIPSSSSLLYYSDSIYKNTFELDPAKQAFQALTVFDSSRVRNEKTLDGQIIPLYLEYIKFPKSFDAYNVKNFTPKASFENKNVCSDKTQLNLEKPNMVTCSFGINVHTTRCFNWISASKLNEFVFIKNGNKWERFESFGGNNNDFGITFKKKSEVYTESTKPIYNRLTGKFPANGTSYTVHKCIIYKESAVTTPTTYTYVIGRAKQDGTPDFNHCSEEYTFTLYPTSYIPRIYQITDLQGFHWVEYLVWAAAANALNLKIEEDCAAEHIIPVLINTGDMTLNGSRINEWLDYYNAGLSLFKHLEQMNCVGNNDLCNVNYNNLGTGDDPGKSNPYYFHVCYCYELPDPTNFIVNGIYIPSTYYFGNDNYKFLIVNSEITYTTCRLLYNLGGVDANNSDYTINLYTGYKVYDKVNSELTYEAEGLFTPIYETIYQWLNTYKNNVKWVAACHEMPFTVVTLANLQTDLKNLFRSVSISGDKSSLVGSHLNLLSVNDKVATHWFSRLLEYFNIDLCIGGHKHTYMCSFPLRENFTWGTNSSETSLYQMPSSLALDNVSFINSTGVNTSKLPYIKVSESTVLPNDPSKFYPGLKYTGALSTVTYFMCLATGYKLKSNKELPAYTLIFSKVVAGNNKSSANENSKESALVSLLFPMFGIINPSTRKVQLVRIKNILKISASNAEVFTNLDFSLNPIQLEYFDGENITSTKVLDNTVEDNRGSLIENYQWSTDSSKYIV